MSHDALTSLVERITERLVPIPIVTPDEYRQITCNRCGICCEDIRSFDPPEVIAAKSTSADLDADRRRFLSGLAPVQQIGDAWQYRCRHFARDAEGLGCCLIHETRPDICRNFPYGRVVRSWRQCAWFVEVRDAQGNVVPEVLPLQAEPGVSPEEERSR